MKCPYHGITANFHDDNDSGILYCYVCFVEGLKLSEEMDIANELGLTNQEIHEQMHYGCFARTWCFYCMESLTSKLDCQGDGLYSETVAP